MNKKFLVFEFFWPKKIVTGKVGYINHFNYTRGEHNHWQLPVLTTSTKNSYFFLVVQYTTVFNL